MVDNGREAFVPAGSDYQSSNSAIYLSPFIVWKQLWSTFSQKGSTMIYYHEKSCLNIMPLRYYFHFIKPIFITKSSVNKGSYE